MHFSRRDPKLFTCACNLWYAVRNSYSNGWVHDESDFLINEPIKFALCKTFFGRPGWSSGWSSVQALRTPHTPRRHGSGFISLFVPWTYSPLAAWLGNNEPSSKWCFCFSLESTNFANQRRFPVMRASRFTERSLICRANKATFLCQILIIEKSSSLSAASLSLSQSSNSRAATN